MVRKRQAAPQAAAQQIRPQTLRERLCHLFHRAATTRVPHWDSLKPQDLPEFDLEAERSLVMSHLTRLALDDSHGDVADRLVEARVAAYGHILDRLIQEQTEALELYRLQGVEHLIRLSEQVAALRQEQAKHSERAASAWKALCGSPPAEAAATRDRAVPISVQPVSPVSVTTSVEPAPPPPTPLRPIREEDMEEEL